MPHSLLPDGDASPEGAARRQQLAALVRDSPACLASLAGSAHLVTVTNQLFRQLFGDRTLAGLRLREVLPELADQPFFDQLDAVYRTGETCHGYETVSFQDAAQAAPPGPVYFTFVAQAVRDAAGVVSGVLLFAYNVSAHVRAQTGPGPSVPPASTARQLAIANQHLAVVNEELDVTNEELLTSNEELRVANERLLGANHQLQLSNEAIRTQAENLRRSEQAVRRLNNDLALTNAGLVDTIADSLQATEFARADAEAQRLRLHRLVAEAPAMIAVLLGPDHVVELANDDFRAMFGHRELVGLPLRQAVPELAGQPFFDQLDAVYRTGETYTGTDVPVTLDRTHSGQLEHLFATYIFQATRDGAGYIDGLLIFAYEVTDQVLARQEREASHQQLASYNAELGNTNEELLVHNETLDGTNQHLVRTNTDLDAFVYTASHDLQGPLNNLDGLLQALHEELPLSERSTPVAHILDLLHESVERFQHTLTNLSAIARAQTAAGQPAPPVPLANVVRDVLLDLALPIAEAGAQLTVDVADCPTVTFAEKNLRSIVYNLLSNAVKYRHPDRVPEVRVHCRTEAPFWVLEVQDNGLGLTLPPGQPRFGLFQRFHTHMDGSGVGLYLVQKLLENEGGHLEVTSQFGEGTTFTLYFKR
ncbi:MAG: ATP-binding protein [Janthinobacterium lividum]